MSTMEATRRPMGLLGGLACACVLALAGFAVFRYLPQIKSALTPAPITIVVTVTPGAVIRASALPVRQPVAPANMATAEAQSQSVYATAVAGAAAQPQPNVGQGAPVEFGERAAPERQPAQGVIPTAEPIPQTQSNDNFGTKPAPPVNIQETHQCRHAQIWVDGAGCKNPTPEGQP